MATASPMADTVHSGRAKVMAELTGQGLANLAWAFAVAGVPHRPLFEALATAALHNGTLFASGPHMQGIPQQPNSLTMALMEAAAPFGRRVNTRRDCPADRHCNHHLGVCQTAPKPHQPEKFHKNEAFFQLT